MAINKAVFVYSQELEKFRYPPEHPFNTARAQKTRQIAEAMGLLCGEDISGVSPEPPDRLVLKKFHSARYLQALRIASKGRWQPEALSMGLGTPDCPIFLGLYDYAVLACGATLVAAKMILKGSADAAFNPSGGYHHAGPERASGFCYINDVALACMVLAEAGKRVLYLDVDVHHGDGVAYAFYDRADVMTISFHQDPRTLFPGTGFVHEVGKGQGKGYCVNVPLPIGTYDEAYMEAFTKIAVPLIGVYAPDVIVFELGADALADDPLANLHLTNNVYVEILRDLLHFGRPILMTGGGGYDVGNTVRAWALAWSVLCGGDIDGAAGVAAGGGSERADWQQRLRDKKLAVSSQQRDVVMPAIDATIEAVKRGIFSVHGI